MPRLHGYRDRTHQPIWDTLVAPPLPCDLWIVRAMPDIALGRMMLVEPDDLASGDGGTYVEAGDPRVLLWATIKHEYPTIVPVEIKHSADVVGWTEVVHDGWRQMID